MCGADALFASLLVVTLGSSPRVRSRPSESSPKHRFRGIISACAEQTAPYQPSRKCPRDHLRVCGADAQASRPLSGSQGSSPRVRSRHSEVAGGQVPVGIISACAEQTTLPVWLANSVKDHLRVCGADVLQFFFDLFAKGSSPRVRSRLPGFQNAGRQTGIISACAEQTR